MKKEFFVLVIGIILIGGNAMGFDFNPIEVPEPGEPGVVNVQADTWATTPTIIRPGVAFVAATAIGSGSQTSAAWTPLPVPILQRFSGNASHYGWVNVADKISGLLANGEAGVNRSLTAWDSTCIELTAHYDPTVMATATATLDGVVGIQAIGGDGIYAINNLHGSTFSTVGRQGRPDAISANARGGFSGLQQVTFDSSDIILRSLSNVSGHTSADL